MDDENEQNNRVVHCQYYCGVSLAWLMENNDYREILFNKDNYDEEFQLDFSELFSIIC